MAYDVVCSKVVVLLLLIQCLLLLPLFVYGDSVFGSSFDIQYFYQLDEEVGASCFTLIVFLMSCDC